MADFTPLTKKIKRRRYLAVDIESKADDTQKAGFTRPFMVGVYDGENFDSTRGVPGKVGNAFSFDGEDDYVNLSLPLIETDYTVAAWVYLERNEGVQVLFSQIVSGSGHSRIQLENRDGRFWAITYFDGIVVAWDTSLSEVGRWYHVAAVGDVANY